MTHIFIPNESVKDPNKELESMGVSQDLDFGGQSTLLKKDAITFKGQRERLKYFKIVIDFKLQAGFTLEGQPFPKNAIPIGVAEYYGLCYGKEALLKMLDTYRDTKRMEWHMELEAIRNAKEIESKILKRD